MNSRVLGPNQALVVGSSNSSDLQIPRDFDVMDQHCSITLTRETCTVEDLTRGEGILQAKGRSIRELTLQGRTKIQVGLAEIEVVVEGAQEREPKTPPKSGNTSDLPAASQPQENQTNGVTNGATPSLANNTASERITPRKPQRPEKKSFSKSTYSNGVHCLTFEDNPQGHEALKNCRLEAHYFDLVNYRAIGDTPEKHDQVDLLQDLTEGDSEDSISISGPETFDGIPIQLSSDKTKDHRMVVFAFTDGDEIPELEPFIDELRVHLAWFIRPSRFHFNIENGLENLVKAIFSKIHSVLFFSVDSGHWTLLTQDPDLLPDLGRE